jgi:hypothetical protein
MSYAAMKRSPRTVEQAVPVIPKKRDLGALAAARRFFTAFRMTVLGSVCFFREPD